MNSTRRTGVVFRRLTVALKQMLHEHCVATGDTEADIAAEMGVASSYLNNMANGHVPPQADLCVLVQRMTGLKHFGIEVARLSGDMYVVVDGLKSTPPAEAADVLRNAAEVVTKYLSAVADGRITATESAEVDAQIAKAQEALAGLKVSKDILEKRVAPRGEI